MPQEETAYLALGCYGRTENGFILCGGVQNRILRLDDTLTNFDGIINYLNAVKLFDRPMLDQNSIRHLIYHIQDKFDQKIKRLWTDHQFNLLERFMLMHKPCGTYAQLFLVPDEFEKPEKKEDIVLIKAKCNKVNK